MGPPITEFVAFRCSSPMASGLSRQALIDGTDRSVLIRSLLREICAQKGINVTSFGDIQMPVVLTETTTTTTH
jgi:hypothetical protein